VWRRSRGLWVRFDAGRVGYQFVETWGWRPGRNVGWSRGRDGISRFFVLLTTRLTPLCVLASVENVTERKKEYYALFLRLEALVVAVFAVTDRLAFYVCFEAVLIPMFVRIGVWGSHQSKVKAAYYFFLYTLRGSVRMRVGIVYRWGVVGALDMRVRAEANRTEREQRVLWLAFFASFAVKVPMRPMHVWRPLAHVQAPTAGSVMLAGILLKRGTYGMVRRRVGVFPAASVFFAPLVYTLAVRAIVYTARTAIRQTDLKRVIAYASVGHMNRTLLGVFSRTAAGMEGALLQMLSHGRVSGALFRCVGVLYDRHHTRLIAYYGGVAQTMPMFVAFFLFFTMANIALPGTSSFVGEFMVRLGVYQTNTVVTRLASSGMVTGGAYSLWLFNRVAYGNRKTGYVGVSGDRTAREYRTFVPRVVLTRVMGVAPTIFRDPMHVSVTALLDHVRRNS